jgi:hypothetical protein
MSMRDFVDPRLPPVMWQLDTDTTAPADCGAQTERLRRRDQIVHSLEVTRRLRRRRVPRYS